ncbi:hypothetical protein B0H34DRAFT_283395 [Crassisporium funariophilum]|nr:hypothetical protein B0H34DRAFT_283395 [Crassisporium funariophilum]
MTQHEYLRFANQEAWVEVDGKKAACYMPVVDTAKKEVTCWIASEAGKVCVQLQNDVNDEKAIYYAQSLVLLRPMAEMGCRL